MRFVGIACLAGVAAFVTGGYLAFAAAGTPKSTPGADSGISAIDSLPAETSLPPDVAKWVELSSASTGSTRGAQASVRKLRADLGSARLAVYAYKSTSGAVCYFLRHQAGICPTNAADARGIHWVMAGGDSNTPPGFLALVADDVTDVTLTVDGETSPLRIVNNVVFAEVSPDYREASVSVTEGTGEVHQIAIPPVS